MFPQFLRYGTLSHSASDSPLNLTRVAFSKTMQLMFIKDLQHRLDEAGAPILCIAVDPGEVRTGTSLLFPSHRFLTHLTAAEGVHAYTESVGSIVGPIYRLIARLAFQTPAQGARSTVFSAGSPIPRAEPNKYRGAYLGSSCKAQKPSKLVQKPELRQELWDTTEKILHDIGLELPPI